MVEQEVREVRNELVVGERVQDFRKESSEHTIVENKVKRTVQFKVSTSPHGQQRSSEQSIQGYQQQSRQWFPEIWSTPSAGSKTVYQSCGQHRCWRISTSTALALLKRLHRSTRP
jgi:hypothetical protein